MIALAIRSFILFTIGIIIIRVMGKSAITQLTPYDLMAIIIIGTVKQIFNKLLLGEPVIIIKHGKIIKENMKKERVSMIQLTSILRSAGFPKLEDIEYAILEPTGEVSIIPKPEVRDVTPADFNIKAEYEGLPIAVIIDGIIQKKNLKLIDKNEEWLKNKLSDNKIDNIQDIIYAYAMDIKDELFISLKHD